MVKRSKRGGYAKGHVSRAGLEWAVIRVVAERGVSGASVDLVAEAAGVTKGAAYWHYPNKTALLLAGAERALEAWMTHVLQAVLGRRTAAERLRAVVFAHVRQVQLVSSPGLYLTRLLGADVGGGALLRTWRARVRQLVGLAATTPPLAPQDARVLIHGLTAGLLGLGLQWEASRDRAALESAAEGLVRGFEAQLTGEQYVKQTYSTVLL